MTFTFRKILSAAVGVVALLACGGSPDSTVVEPPPPDASQPPPPPDVPQPPTGTATIAVAFMLDPRLQGGTYGGEVWVSPATYQGIVGQNVVETQAHGIDGTGALTDAIPEWIASDPGMVSVSPARGTRVTITVTRTGESTLTVSAGAMSKDLLVRATSQGGVVERVSIAQ